MSNSPSFVQHALELLEQVGPIRARSMFGGHGLSLNGTSIGLIDDDWLYLRVDDQTRPQFEAAGSRAFTYPSKNGPMTMNSYWALPEEAIDDPDVAAKWGRLAAEVAARAEARKKAKAPRPKRSADARDPRSTKPARPATKGRRTATAKKPRARR